MSGEPRQRPFSRLMLKVKHMNRSSDTRLQDLTRRLEAATAPPGLGAEFEATVADDATATIRQSLQYAIELELSTLPPYLCALWSIKDHRSPVYGLIKGVCMNEMLHMGLVCNMLTALGGQPDIKNAYYANIKYPTDGLPGGALPGLRVDLGSLTLDRVVNQFQKIETPEHEIPSAAAELFTIGRFYDALAAALPADGWTGGKPVTDGFINPQITSLATAQSAIALIKEQGEGTSALPYADNKTPPTLAHFYIFEEIAKQNLITGTTGNPPTLVWQNPPAPTMQLPAAYDMKSIDPGGRYLNPPAGVASALRAFNQKWDALLTDLDEAWQNDDLGTAVNDMFGLKAAALGLFTPEPFDPAQPNLRYGPEFMSPLP